MPGSGWLCSRRSPRRRLVRRLRDRASHRGRAPPLDSAQDCSPMNFCVFLHCISPLYFSIVFLHCISPLYFHCISPLYLSVVFLHCNTVQCSPLGLRSLLPFLQSGPASVSATEPEHKRVNCDSATFAVNIKHRICSPVLP